MTNCGFAFRSILEAADYILCAWSFFRYVQSQKMLPITSVKSTLVENLKARNLINSIIQAKWTCPTNSQSVFRLIVRSDWDISRKNIIF